jgi:hypothetical protein
MMLRLCFRWSHNSASGHIDLMGGEADVGGGFRQNLEP